MPLVPSKNNCQVDEPWYLGSEFTKEDDSSTENGWLEDEFPFGARPIFRGELLVLGRVSDCHVPHVTVKSQKVSAFRFGRGFPIPWK